MMMKSSTYKAPTIYFSGPRDLEICANIPDPLGTAKGSGDCKNVGADRATQIAPTCANHFVSPQRVWGRDDIVRALLAESVPIFEGPSFFCLPLVAPPHHHFPLQSELLGERNLYQFNALNPPVISICP